LVIGKGLAGPIGIFVKFSTLQDYGVDKVFLLENGNADVSQQNVVFIARGECAKHAQSIAGTFMSVFSPFLEQSGIYVVDGVAVFLALYIFSLEPEFKQLL
jgi:hypothetical protein